MIGADLVVQTLKAHGVSFVSTLIGNGIDPVLIAARRAGLRVVDTHNEQTAAHMADSYARLTGRIGVSAVSSSVGFTNALIGAVNARFDGPPCSCSPAPATMTMPAAAASRISIRWAQRPPSSSTPVSSLAPTLSQPPCTRLLRPPPAGVPALST